MKYIHYVIVVIALLAGGLIGFEIASSATNQSNIRFLQYHFPEYAENAAQINGLNLSVISICAIDNKTVLLFGNLAINNVAGSHRSIILRSDDRGQHWQEVIAPEYNESFYHVAFVDDGVGWALSALDVEDFTAGNLYRSFDYGKTWSQHIGIGEWGFHPWGMKFSDKKNGYIKFEKFTANPYTDRFGIIATTDGGLTWNETLSVLLLPPAIDNSKLEQIRDKFFEPPGSSYGYHWSMGEWKETPNSAKGHDGSEWLFYFHKETSEYIILQRPQPKAAWIVASVLSSKFNYSDGYVKTP